MTARSFALLSALGCAAFAGCTRPAPTLERVEAKNYGTFYYWRSAVSAQFSADGWRDFNDAIQELRISAMTRGVTGTDAINQALCDEINGRSAAEVLRLADRSKLQRFESMRARLKTIVDANALLGTRPGDDDLAQALADRRTRQEQQLAGLIRDIKATKRRLIAHGGTVPAALADELRPAVLSRAEARNELARLIVTRRQIAMEQYGDWTAQIDRDGAELGDAQRAAFEEKRAEAPANGHVVIPVYVRNDWRIFDGPANFPRFSDSVLQNLTPEDRREIEEEWADSEAEIWARRQASRESAAKSIANIKSDIDAVMR